MHFARSITTTNEIIRSEWTGICRAVLTDEGDAGWHPPRRFFVDADRCSELKPRQLLMLFEASSQRTLVLRKYDSFAMWQASAAL
jgi:hypothetical protein